ncbi:MAG: hypothetical protein IT304_09910 [Dehalococcoidia bacterium]|nr:hypothetical protein [Dehalococcoidia bacterium]
MALSGPDSGRTASVVFTLEELWLLQSVIRHEIVQKEQWQAPPADADFNDQVVESLYRCETLGLGEAALVLRWNDCLVIDFCVPQSAKSPSGAAIGKNVLMKSFRARKEIREGTAATADEPGTPSASEIQEQLRNMNGGS